MTTRRRWVLRGLLATFLIVACEQLWRHGRDYVFARQFAEVVPGKIYRGGWQQPWPMRRIVAEHKIKTIVALAHPPDHPLAIREQALAHELGVRWYHIPIVDERGLGDPRVISDRLEEAAAIVADPNNQPVYFHCHHGINRASMVQIAYRTKHCGWTLPEATAEIARTFGLREVSHGPDYRHMQSFYADRVLPYRRKQGVPSTAAGPNGDRPARF
jgi:hypothetical protein